MGKEAKRKRKGPKPLSPKKSLFVLVFLFPEVALEEASEGLAVSCFVAGHFVDGPPFRYAPRRGYFGQILPQFIIKI